MKYSPIELDNLSVSEYESLEDKSQVDVVLEFINPSERLVMKDGTERFPTEESMTDYSFRAVIFFKNCLRESDINSVLYRMYDIDSVAEANVYSLTAVYKWIGSEMERIIKNESRLSSSKDADAWKSAGMERMGAFGEYFSLYILCQDITKEDAILDLPFYRVFDYMECQKVWNEVLGAFQNIKSKQK